MNTSGVGGARIVESNRTQPDLTSSKLSGTSIERRTANDGASRPAITPAGMMATSAEELTFQFSEVAEAKQTALEERVARHAKINLKSNTIQVTQIVAIMKLLEGKEGYEILRGQARSFAASFRMNPDAALNQLELTALPAKKKFALINMALDTFEDSSTDALAKSKLSAMVDKMSNPFSDESTLVGATSDFKEVDADAKDILFGALSIRPTIRTIWDLMVEKSNSNLAESMSEMQATWEKLNDVRGLEQVGAIIILHKIIQLIRSMVHSTDNLLDRMGLLNIKEENLHTRYARNFIDMAQSSMPSTLIDKTIDNLKTAKRRCVRCGTQKTVCLSCKLEADKCKCQTKKTCNCADMRTYILSLLHLHVRQWPADIWINVDAKKIMLDQLLKKQNAPTGLLAQRMMG